MILLHPSQLSDIKSQVLIELNKKLFKWDDQLKGIILSFSGVQILNGGRGRIMDDFQWVHHKVRFSAVYIQPSVGEKIRKTLAG